MNSEVAVAEVLNDFQPPIKPVEATKAQILPIMRHDDPMLRKVSRPIAQGEFTMPEFKAFADNLKATMNTYTGVGIAAIQCGVPVRLIIIARGNTNIVMANPVLKEVDSKEVESSEGCLSYPGAYAKRVSRPVAVKVAYQDLDGNVNEDVFTGFQARAVCHEIEHLDGKLLIDHVRKIDRQSFRDELTKFSRLVQKHNKMTNPKPLTNEQKRGLQKAKKANRK